MLTRLDAFKLLFSYLKNIKNIFHMRPLHEANTAQFCIKTPAFCHSRAGGNLVESNT